MCPAPPQQPAGWPRPPARKPYHRSYEVDHVVGWCRELGFYFPRNGDFPRISSEFRGSSEIRSRPARSSKKWELGPSSFFSGGRAAKPAGFGSAGSRDAFRGGAALAWVGGVFRGFLGFPRNSSEIILSRSSEVSVHRKSKIQTEECRNETSKTSASFCTKNY